MPNSAQDGSIEGLRTVRGAFLLSRELESRRLELLDVGMTAHVSSSAHLIVSHVAFGVQIDQFRYAPDSIVERGTFCSMAGTLVANAPLLRMRQGSARMHCVGGEENKKNKRRGGRTREREEARRDARERK